MFGKFFSWVGGVVDLLRGRVSLWSAMLSVGVVGLMSGTLLAQDSTAIPVQAPNIDWQSLPGTLINVLTTPVVVGIGIALSIWVILKAMAFFKRAA